MIAFGLPDYVCSFGKLRLILRCESRLCRYRPIHWADERIGIGEEVAGGRDARFIAEGSCSGASNWRSCDMASIGVLAERYGFAVLEDASHAIGGGYRGEPVGNCRNSAITVFSFHPVKIITTGEGGLATTNDPVLSQRMAELRSHGIVRDSNRFVSPAVGPWAYEQQQLGYNYRMTDIQAALGLNQLQRLDEIVAERNRQLKYYRVLLADLPVQLLAITRRCIKLRAFGCNSSTTGNYQST